MSYPHDPERAGLPSSGNSPKARQQGDYLELGGGQSGLSQSDLRLPDGQVPVTKVGRVYSYLVSASIVTRWILFIVPILGIIWIPGILNLTSFPNAKVWGVKLIWWSIWLSVLWGGACVSKITRSIRIAPYFIRATVGVVAVSSRRYIDWLQALHRYIALFAWTVALWASFSPLIISHQDGRTDTVVITNTTLANLGEAEVNGVPSRSVAAVSLMAKLLFSFLLCTALLLFEKFSIQWIAAKFHERSYADRIQEQKFAVRTLVTLYRNSSEIPGRSDTLGRGHTREVSVNPKRLFRKFREGVRFATTTTATAFGNVASEIAGSSVLQPNSPQAIIKTVLESANKSRLLARRLYYSFAKKDAEYLLVEDIQRFFPTKEDADAAFALFDKDGNGDVSREEIEMACLEFHREQLSIENSMRDLDSAVGRLDNILMTVYVIIAGLIIAVGLEAQLVTLVTSAGTLILGLSWLIGGSLQEVLTSIIFLFIKHPFDVGDRVVLNKETYTVKEIRLLSTVFLDSNSGLVQAPNNQLNTLMSETFTFDVAYSTSFEDLERLREKMLAFVTAERRDYQSVFDVKVKDFPDQGRMTLSADIKYKSNGQQAALKSKRRNKWICALKASLGELKIYGPSGDPNPPPGVTRYTKVPWETIQANDRKNAAGTAPQMPQANLEQMPPLGGWQLSDKNTAILDNTDSVFGDSADLYPRREMSQDSVFGDSARQRGAATTTASQPPSASRNLQPSGPPHPADVFEMRPR
ncbi:Mechanosensitive ion channel protein Msy2 [Psilocybe cubensis]|uniref:Mechanosensitive ion channel protein Msy2 n=2 Tax=Psilocybe cubensis TaxID=181762 RepID=A0ACB8HDZ0_PSICU|nr:Mechanosensitive ion channel protein Msy2 [Psilocybe cubensis]KAH9485389.1 Mechanosensitive ion channel protein Msy2 [Psilocybe cubensis]